MKNSVIIEICILRQINLNTLYYCSTVFFFTGADVGAVDAAVRVVAIADPEHVPSAVSLVSGPSRTNDIEKISTLGAHGALAEHVVIIR